MLSVPTLGAKGMPSFIINVSSGLENQPSQKKRKKGVDEEEAFGFEVLQGNWKY